MRCVEKYREEADSREVKSPISTNSSVYTRLPCRAEIEDRIKEYRLQVPRHRLTFPNTAGLNARSDLNDFIPRLHACQHGGQIS